jgi:hypothetical protein
MTLITSHLHAVHSLKLSSIICQLQAKFGKCLYTQGYQILRLGKKKHLKCNGRSLTRKNTRRRSVRLMAPRKPPHKSATFPINLKKPPLCPSSASIATNLQKKQWIQSSTLTQKWSLCSPTLACIIESLCLQATASIKRWSLLMAVIP